jgi:hypothetical protein
LVAISPVQVVGGAVRAPQTLDVTFRAQRTKNTTPAILIHFRSNGLGVMLTIVPLLTA